MNRKITYVDVGKMSPKKAEKFLKEMKNKFRKGQEQKNIERYNNKVPKNYPKTF